MRLRGEKPDETFVTLNHYKMNNEQIRIEQRNIYEDLIEMKEKNERIKKENGQIKEEIKHIENFDRKDGKREKE